MTVRQIEIFQHSQETALGLDKETFYDLCREFSPELDREEFEEYWSDFQRQKREREARSKIQ